MPRKRLTLDDLVERREFDVTNHRHRRALDESREPLADAELEKWRRIVLSYRRSGDRAWAAPAMRTFAQLVERR